jgi:hypothetical protein
MLSYNPSLLGTTILSHLCLNLRHSGAL